MSPVLVMLAAVALLEGYGWLKVFPTVDWRPATVVFAVVATPLVVATARRVRQGDGRWVALSLTGTVVMVVAVTGTVVAVPRPPVTQLMGTTDLVFTGLALGVALVNERKVVRRGAGPR